jgi:hypothetical protein
MGYYWSKPDSPQNTTTEQHHYGYNSSFNPSTQSLPNQLLQPQPPTTAPYHLYNNFQPTHPQFNPQPNNDVQLILLQLQNISSRLTTLENIATHNVQIQQSAPNYNTTTLKLQHPTIYYNNPQQ